MCVSLTEWYSNGTKGARRGVRMRVLLRLCRSSCLARHLALSFHCRHTVVTPERRIASWLIAHWQRALTRSEDPGRICMCWEQEKRKWEGQGQG